MLATTHRVEIVHMMSGRMEIARYPTPGPPTSNAAAKR